MNDFEYDCLQKKRIAGQAKYRKRGSKSKKCNLPSDRLSQKQWKERCGPIVSFNFNKPMDWGAFKKLPTTIQAEYITNLQKKYGATAVDLGNMFGVRALTVRKYADANELNIVFPRGHAMNATQRAEWGNFLGMSTQDSSRVAAEHCPKTADLGVPGIENDERHSNINNNPINTNESIESKPMNMTKFSLQFSGAINVDMIANSLKLILGDNSEGELDIVCNLR